LNLEGRFFVSLFAVVGSLIVINFSDDFVVWLFCLVLLFAFGPLLFIYGVKFFRVEQKEIKSHTHHKP